MRKYSVLFVIIVLLALTACAGNRYGTQGFVYSPSYGGYGVGYSKTTADVLSALNIARVVGYTALEMRMVFADFVALQQQGKRRKLEHKIANVDRELELACSEAIAKGGARTACNRLTQLRELRRKQRQGLYDYCSVPLARGFRRVGCPR